MADAFDINPIPVIQVTIDRTGPQGSGSEDTVARSQIASHAADASDPHGAALIQTTLATIKATVGIVNGGSISSNQTINFVNGGCYVCTATGTLTLTVTSLAAGQRGSVHILAGTPAPTISWTGVGIWIGGAPTFSNGKLTVVTLFNDGTRIVGSSGIQL